MKYEEMPYSRIDFCGGDQSIKELMEEFQTAKCRRTVPCPSSIMKERDISDGDGAGLTETA